MANGTYFQFYSDDRDVCCEMSIGDGKWSLWRDGEPFPQRIIARISQGSDTITGRWEKAEDGINFHNGLDLTYTRIN